MPSRKNNKRSNQTARKTKQTKDSRRFRKVFVNGLSKETSKEMIRRHFEQYGEIEELVKLQHRSSPENFYAFVVFETEGACHAATQNPCPIIGNDNVYCALAAIGQDFSGLKFFKDAGILKDRSSNPKRRSSKKGYQQAQTPSQCDDSVTNGAEANVRRFSASLMGEQIQKLRIHVNAPPLDSRPRTSYPSPPGLVDVNPTPSSSHRRYSDSDYESPKRSYSARSPQRYAFAGYYQEMPSPNTRSHRQVFLEQQLTQCTPPVPIDTELVDFVESPHRSSQYAMHSSRNQQPTLGVPPPSLKPIWPPTASASDSMRYSPSYSPQQYSPSYGVASAGALYETDAYDADPFRCVCAPSPPGMPSGHSSQHVSPVHTPSHHTPAHTPLARSPSNPFGYPSVGMVQPLFPPPSPSPPPPVVPL